MRMLDFPEWKHFIFSQPFGAKSVTNPAAGHLRQRLAIGPYVHEAEAALEQGCLRATFPYGIPLYWLV